ncbi:hypothetical protein ACVDG3_12805 [Meridianimarinicoccus sp. RP-17]|uniref:hypothetical protein n=1 Tax=Meridianimarinicoccus zhengii TaxID=2056810 RepID=UPI000DADF898|nr:hypothetical protein [Phycocomes zhengii]
MRHILLCLPIPAMLAACAPAAPDAVTPVTSEVTCEASFFEYLRGEPIAVVDTLQTGLNVRVLGPDDFVPRDFDANRLTFTTAPDDTVSRVFCG